MRQILAVIFLLPVCSISHSKCVGDYVHGSLVNIFAGYTVGVDRFGVIRNISPNGEITDLPACLDKNVLSVAVGFENLAVLTAVDAHTQRITLWGRSGLKSDGTNSDQGWSMQAPNGAVMISRQLYDGMVMTRDGEVYRWTYANAPSPYWKIEGLPKMKYIASGYGHAGIDSTGRVWEWGNYHSWSKNGPIMHLWPQSARMVSIWKDQMVILTTNGQVFIRLPSPGDAPRTPIRLANLPLTKKVSAGSNFGVALAESGAVVAFSMNQSAGEKRSLVEVVPREFQAIDVAAKENGAFVLSKSGCVYEVLMGPNLEVTSLELFTGGC